LFTLAVPSETKRRNRPLRRVLVIAYYFPPMGLSGVQRVAKFVKYLPEHGWQPTVLTIEPAGYFAYDTTLLHEVKQAGVAICRTASWDPTRFFRRHQTIPLPSELQRRRLSRSPRRAKLVYPFSAMLMETSVSHRQYLSESEVVHT